MNSCILVLCLTLWSFKAFCKWLICLSTEKKENFFIAEFIFGISFSMLQIDAALVIAYESVLFRHSLMIWWRARYKPARKYLSDSFSLSISWYDHCWNLSKYVSNDSVCRKCKRFFNSFPSKSNVRNTNQPFKRSWSGFQHRQDHWTKRDDERLRTSYLREDNI